MIPLGIVFGVMFYLMYLNGQNPAAFLQQLAGRMLDSMSQTGSSIQALPQNVGDSLGAQSRTFYKWQDASGAWHYGEAPPSDARALEAISLKLTDNVVPSFQAPAPIESEEEEPETAPSTDQAIPIESPYSPDQIKKLFEDAKQLQETLNQRQLDQGALIGLPAAE